MSLIRFRQVCNVHFKLWRLSNDVAARFYSVHTFDVPSRCQKFSHEDTKRIEKCFKQIWQMSELEIIFAFDSTADIARL